MLNSDHITNEQLALLITAVGILLTFLNSKSTASAGAIGALSTAITSLQNLRKQDLLDFERKLREERTLRENERSAMQAELNAEKEAREKMAKDFELERLKYQVYIKSLITAMQKANIPIPEWDEKD